MRLLRAGTGGQRRHQIDKHGSGEATQHDATSDGRAGGLNCYANRREGLSPGIGDSPGGQN